MNKRIEKKVIFLIDQLSSVLLDNPYLFNHVRYLLAGNQAGMKSFIGSYLKEYNCLSVIDICSGTGDFAATLPKNASYIGLDLNNEFIDFARKKYKGHKNIRFVKADVINSQKVKIKKSDAVLLISTIHHFSDEDLAILLPFVKKLTKKVVIIADIIPDPPHILQRFFAKIDRGKHVRPAKQKIKILKKYFKIKYTVAIPTKTAVQFGIICEI